MDFVGTGKRLSQGDIGEAARWLGVPTAALLAFVEIEAAGRGFDAQNRPKMLFEPHVFWRELGKGAFRDVAVALGLAYPKWGEKPYPKDSYPRLIKAVERIDKVRALRSASWGLGQILADKAQTCGHASEADFVRANMAGEREQMLCMVALMIAWGIPKMLAGKDLTKSASWADAAKKWNGAGYAKHNYHGRIAAAFAKHDKNLDAETGRSYPDKIVVPKGSPVLEKGMKGEAVRNLQNDLAALGYKFELGIDGRFGNETDVIVRNFQSSWGLTVDGKVGENTQKAIAEALKRMGDKIDTTPAPVTHPDQKSASAAPIWVLVAAGLVVAAGVGIAIISGAFNVG